MTIEEAIKHLKDLTKCENYLWSSEVQAINAAINSIEENKRMKELLKLAVEDIEKMSNYLCDNCYDDGDGDYFCKWKHKDEAMKLIGGD